MTTVKQRIDTAITAFNSGLNCAQSVLTAYSDLFPGHENTVIDITTGFGGGIGRLQETCGAVTGSTMIIGLYNSLKTKDLIIKNEQTVSNIQEFTFEFKQIHGTILCKDLINCDLNTTEGQKCFTDNNLREKVCVSCISDSIGILTNMFSET